MDKNIEIIKSDIVYNGFFKLLRYKLSHRLFSGGMSKPFTREILERGHAVAVLLHDPILEKIVLIEQFRIGAIRTDNAWLTELVAGIVEEGESAEDVAVREAEEECGAKIDDLEFIAHYFNSAGGSSETTTLYYAQLDSSMIDGVHGLVSENEDIRVIKVDVSEFTDNLLTNQYKTASLVTAGYWFLNKEYQNRKTK